MEDENSQIRELALAVLDARDYAIGAAAELGEPRVTPVLFDGQELFTAA